MAGTRRQPHSRVARLTLRGWTLMVNGGGALTIAYLAGRSELLPLGAFLIALPAAAWLYVRLRPLRVNASRQFSPAVIAVRQTSAVTLDVSNHSRNRSPVANWRDTLPWSPFVTAPRQLQTLAAVEPHRSARGRVVRLGYSLSPTRRGQFTIGPFIVYFSDPFGLADGVVAAKGSARLTVTPQIIELPAGAVTIAAAEGATRQQRRKSFGGEDDLMTREYRQGDAMRRVHWRASAHHGELMVRQEEQRSHAESTIVLDTVRSSYGDSRGADSEDEPESEAFEWSVSFCTSLSLHLVDRGFRVRVVETGAPQLAPLDQRDEFLESVAAVQLADPAADRMPSLRPGVRADRQQGTLFAVLSDGTAARTIDRLVAQSGSFEMVLAFVVGSTGDSNRGSTSSLTRLRETGWICVATVPGTTVDDAWRAIGAEQERLHDSR